MSKIKVNDFVVAIKQIEDIEERSVGFVESVSGKNIIIFFIGKKKTLITTEDKVQFLDVHKTGKSFPKKICNICHLLKDEFTDFAINQTDAGGKKTTRPSCTACRVEIDGNKFIPSENRKLEAIKPKYLFTCPLCNKITIVGVTVKLVKDHDHLTGKGREWICDSCNTGLGRFKDDIATLQKVIDYLKKYL